MALRGVKDRSFWNRVKMLRVKGTLRIVFVEPLNESVNPRLDIIIEVAEPLTDISDLALLENLM